MAEDTPTTPLFWKLMGPANNPGIGGSPSAQSPSRSPADFGDFEAFKKTFNETTAKQFGSGWGWLVFSGGKLKVITTANQDSPLSQGLYPILGNDVWEHAYYLKYQNRRPDYLAAWWNVVNWAEVNKRFASAFASLKGLTVPCLLRLSAASQLAHVQLSATVNGSAVNVTAAPDSAQLLLNISANGRSSTTRLAAHPAAVFLPDFDPGALETLLVLDVTQSGRDLWAVLPKQSGTEPATVAPITVATYADEHGTLDGKPISVHHLVASIAQTRTDLFSGPENQLLQAELPQQGFALIRRGFVLTPPTKPLAPAQ
jgi:hypothetical protein